MPKWPHYSVSSGVDFCESSEKCSHRKPVYPTRRIPKYIKRRCGLYTLIAMIAITAMTKAIAGKNGYMGTRKGRSISGCFFRRAKNDSMETIYKVSAPKQAMVIISPVFPVISAKIPIPMLTSKAFTGVWVLACTLPSEGKMYRSRPSSKVDLPAARIIP